MPSGLMTPKRPIPGRSPKNLAFASPLPPRPCGEMTTGSAGFRPGPYQAGSTTYAGRVTPLWATYEMRQTRTASCAPTELPGSDAMTAPAIAAAPHVRRRHLPNRRLRGMPATLGERPHRQLSDRSRLSLGAVLASIATKGRPVEFRLLGPVEVVRDGSPLPVGGAKPRALLT